MPLPVVARPFARFGLALMLFAGVSRLSAQIITTNWSGTADWNSANWTTVLGGLHTVPLITDVAGISSGTVTVSDARSVGAIAFSGGTITGAGTLTISGSGSTWTGGSMSSSVASTLVISSGASITVSGTSDHDFNFRTISNSGTIDWTGGRLRSGNGGGIVNAGAFNDSTTGTSAINNDFGGTGGSTFTNNGTYAKTGSGTTSIAQFFNNNGTLNIQAGTLKLDNTSSFSAASPVTVSSGAALQFNASGTVTDATVFSGAGSILLTGGTLTLGGTLGSAGGFSQSGGTLAGTQTFNTPFTWTAGLWNSSGTTTIASTRTLTISGSADHDFDSHTVVINGIVDWSQGRLRSGHGGTFTISSGGAFNDSTSASTAINNDYSGTGGSTFTNNGTFTKSGATTTTISQFFNNGGTLNVQAGTLKLDNTSSFSAASPVTVSNSAALQFNANGTVADAAVFSGTGSILLTGGTLTLSGTFGSAGGFSQSGGTLAGTHTFNGPFTWTAGLWNSTGTTTIAATRTLTISGSADHDFDGHAVVINGIVDWSQGRLRSGHGGTFTIASGGAFNDATPSSTAINNDYSGTGGSTFTNNGTYTKSGAGTTSVNQVFNNGGTLNLQAGTLRLDSTNSFSAASPVTVSNGAALQFNATGTVADAAVFSGLGSIQLTGGTLTLAGTFGSAGGFSQSGGTLAGTQTFNAPFAWTAGLWNSSGTTTIASTRTLTISGGADHDYDGHAVVINGIVDWSQGRLRSGHGGTLTIASGGAFNDSNAASTAINNDYGGTGNSTFINNGTYTKSGAGTTSINQTFNNNGAVSVTNGTLSLTGGGTTTASGSINLGSGGGFNIGGGSYTFDSGAVLTGTGTFSVSSGTLSIAAGTLTLPNLTVSGGTLGGVGSAAITGLSTSGGNVAIPSLTLTGAPTWTGGTWNGSSASTATLAAGATLAISSGNDHDFNFRTLTNNGTINWTGGRLRSGNGGGLVNAGTFNDSNAASNAINNDYGGTGGSTFTNSGAYTKSGAGTTSISQTFNNNGVVSVTNGTLSLTGGGTTTTSGSITVGSSGSFNMGGGNYTFDSGTVLTGTGTFSLSSGTLSIAANTLTLPNLAIGGGTLGGAGSAAITGLSTSGGNIAIPSLTLTGAPTWTGGTWNAASAGTATLVAGTTLAISSGNDHDFNLRTITNNGTINWTGGRLRSGNGGGLINAGLFNDSNTASNAINNDYGGTGGSTFTNSGTYTKSGAGTTSVGQVFNNNGTVNLNAGTLSLDSGGNASASSVFNIGAGSLLRFGGGNYTFVSASNLSFTGTTSITGGNVTVNAGVFSPPALTMTGGSLNVVDAGAASSIPTVTLSGGTLTMAGALATTTLTQSSGSLGAATLTINGNSSWTGGDWNTAATSTATLANGVTLTLSGVNVKDFNRRTITNNGVVNWQDGQLRSGNGSGFVNATGATFNDSASNLFNAAYGGSSSFTNNGTYNKTAAGTTTFQSAFNNNGTVNLSAGTLSLDGGGSASAGSVFNIGAGSLLRFGGGSYTFASASNLSFTGTTSITGGNVTLNAGVFSPPSLTMTGGSLNAVDAGAASSIPTITLSGGTITMAGSLATTTLTQSSGSLGAATLTTNGNSSWTGGDWNSAAASTAILATGVTLTLSGANVKDFNQRTITNNGIVNWQDGQLRSGNGGGIVNATGATFNDSASNVFTAAYGGSASFTNNGTYNKTATGTTSLQSAFNNNGTVNLNSGTLSLDSGGSASAGSVFNIGAGSLLRFGGGNYTLASSSNLSFTGTTSITGGNVTLNAGVFSPPSLTMTGGSLNAIDAGAASSIPTISLSGGTITIAGSLATTTLTQSSGSLGAATLTINGNASWTAGDWNTAAASTATLASGATLTLSGANVKDFNQRTITNNGIVNWQGGQLRSGIGGGIINAVGGTFNDSASSVFNAAYGGSASFTNNGTYNKTAAGTTSFQSPFTNNGTVTLNAGTLSIDNGGTANAGSVINVAAGTTLNFSGGTFTLANPTTLAGNGSYSVAGGTLSISSGTLFLPTLSVTSGAFPGAGGVSIASFTQSGGSMSLDSLALTGPATWTAGDWNGAAGSTATIGSGATLTLATTSVHDFSRRAITNNGTVNWQGGQFRTGQSGSFVNQAGGTFNDSASSSINAAYTGAASFTNNGTYNKTSAGTTTIAIPFTNSGTVRSQNSGTLSFTSTFTNNAGGTLIADGGNLSFSNPLNVGTGTLRGAGTVTASTVTAGGNVQPGNPSGLLTIAGNLTLLGTATSQFEIGGATRGSTFDAIHVTGTATLAGALGFSFLNGTYASLVGTESFNILDATSVTGAFSNIASGSRLDSTDGVGSFLVTLSPTSLTLSNFVLNVGTYVWAGGDLITIGNVSPAVLPSNTVGSSSVLAIVSGADHDFNGQTLTNNGRIDWGAGRLRSGDGGSIVNNGTFNDAITAGTDVNADFGNHVVTFTNATTGIYNKSGAVTTRFYDVPFNNSGTVNVLAGTLQLNGGGTNAAIGIFNTSAGAVTQFTNNYSLADGSNLGGDGSYLLSNGALNAAGTVTIAKLDQVGGALVGSATFANSLLNWTGGSWNTGAAATTTIASTSRLVVDGGIDHDYNQRAIVNNGVIDWNSGRLRSGDGGAITNNAAFNDNLVAATDINADWGNHATTFINGANGIYTKNGNATTRFYDVPFNNNGQMKVLAGTLQLNGGGTNAATGTFVTADTARTLFTNNYSLTGGSMLTGDGTYELSGGTLDIAGTVTISDLQQTGGALGNSQTFANSQITWTAGTWNTGAAATTTIGATSLLSITGGVDHDYNQRGIVNNGTVDWFAGRLRSGDGGSITNNAHFNDRLTAGTDINADWGNHVTTFTNSLGALYSKLTNVVTRFYDVPFNNSGVVSVDAGTLQLNGGGTNAATGVFSTAAGARTLFTNNYALTGGSNLSGAGTYELVGGALDVSGSITVSNLQLNGGALVNSQTFANSQVTWSTTNWNAGGASTTTVNPTSRLIIAGTADHDFNQRSIVNQGTIDWNAGRLRTGDGGAFTNFALFNDQIAASTDVNADWGNHVGTFTNASGATYTKSTATTTRFVDVPFNNSGQVNVDAGTLQIGGGGSNTATGRFAIATGASLWLSNSYTLASGSNLLGPGPTNATGGALSINGTVIVDNLFLDGSLLAGTQTFQGNTTWRNSSLNSTGTTIVATGSNFTITTAVDHDFNGRSLVNNGTVEWSAGRLRTGDGGSIFNAGTWNDTASSDINADWGNHVASFTNTGSYNKNASGVTNVLIPFTNDHGSIAVAAGTLQFSNTFTQIAGSLAVSQGAALQFNAGLNLSAGTLSGSGTIIGNVTNQGQLSPGSSPGQLNINGNLTLASTSVLLIELGGVTQGTTYDFLNVSGTAALDGSLRLALVDNASNLILPTDVFTVMTASSLSGVFSNLPLSGSRLSIFDGVGSFQVNYGVGSAFAANSLVLSNFVAVPEPSTWVLMGIGAVFVAWQIRRRKQP